ncbi:MAG: amidoligase family protein [Eggerthellaceae bacterium]|nr:amidoligase family protein [Eggerthellaceae bacterium]
MTTRRRRGAPPTTEGSLLDACRHCGEFFVPGDSPIEGVCPACASERYEECPECRQLHMRDAFVTLEGGRRICRECAREAAFRCAECGRWFLASEVRHITDHRGNRICEHCRIDWSMCERCDEWYRNEEMHDGNIDGHSLCCRCAADATRTGVQSYYFKPRPVFHREDGEPEDGLLLGVELEMDHGDGDMAAARITEEFGSSWLYFKNDGSLEDGVELVTHPISPAVMASEPTRAMWARIREIALEEGLRSHDTRTCGLHVHVNRDYFGEGETAQEMAELKLCALADRFFEPLTIFSRRRSEQLHRWAKRPMLPKTEDCWRKRAKNCHDMASCDRYRAVNVTNEATIEFRLFRGTLKTSTLMATFQFVSGLCALAKASTVGKLEKMTWYELCDAVIAACPTEAAELEAYLVERELMTPKEDLKCA